MKDFTELGDDGRVYLTTTKLEQHLGAWRLLFYGSDASREERKQYSQHAFEGLEEAAAILRHLASFLSRLYNRLRAAGHDLSPADDVLGMSHTACVLLHQALVHACRRILVISVRAGNALSTRTKLPWLKWRMRSETWCPYTVEKLFLAHDIDGLVYGYSLGTVRRSQAHNECTEKVCLANNA